MRNIYVGAKEFKEESSLYISRFRMWKVNRKPYKNRDPLGFFRFSGSINALRQSDVLNQHEENYICYRDFFKERSNGNS